jgi:hypothetical protein
VSLSECTRRQRGGHGGSVSELDSGGTLVVVGAVDVLGLLSVLELMPPRARIGPGRLRGLLVPVALPRPDGLRRDVAPDDTLGVAGLRVAGLVKSGVEVGPGEPPAGAQLTPGVIIGDGLVALLDLVELVPVVPLLLVVPVLLVVCANAGAVLKAIAHARPTPLRIGIFRILVKIFLLRCHLRSTVRLIGRSIRHHPDRCKPPAHLAVTAAVVT